MKPPAHQQIGRGRPRLELGTVYYIGCAVTQRLKIGFTAGDPLARLRGLQTGSPGELKLLAAHPGTRDDEAALHDHFKGQRLHGEWFEMDQELFEHLCYVVRNYAHLVVKLSLTPPTWLSRGLQMTTRYYGDDLDEEIRGLA